MNPLAVFSSVIVLSLATVPLSRAQSGDTKAMAIEKKSEGKSHRGAGMVKKIDPKAGTVTLEHGAVRSMNWPAMTMALPIESAVALFIRWRAARPITS